MKKPVFMSMVLMLAGVGASAGDDNGIVRQQYVYEIPPAEAFFVPCINDWVYGTETYEVLYHQFRTPSAVVHVVASYFGTVSFTALSSGHSWVGRAVAPQELSIKPVTYAGVHQYTLTYKAVPLESGDPAWLYKSGYKWTINADGTYVHERSYQRFICPGTAK